jgi:hypothetical protein
MKHLGAWNFAWIAKGAKTFGTFDPQEIFPVFEEQLKVDEAPVVWDFLNWVHTGGHTFGYGNYEQVFEAYLNQKETDIEAAIREAKELQKRATADGSDPNTIAFIKAEDKVNALLRKVNR